MKSGKLSYYKLLLQCIISLSVLGLMVMYFIKNGNGDTVNETGSGDFVVFIAAGLLAVLGIIVAIYQNKRKALQLKALSSDYLQTYDQLMAHIENSNIAHADKKSVSSDLVSLLHEGQLRHVMVNDIIGGDVREFSNKIIEALGGKMTWLLYFITGIQYFLCYLLFIKAADNMNIVHNFKTYLNAQVDNSSVALFAVVSLVVIPLIFILHRKYLVKQNLMIMLGIFLAIPVTSVVLFKIVMDLLKQNLMHIELVEQLINGKMDIVNSLAGVILLVGIVCMGIVIKRYVRFKQIRNV